MRGLKETSTDECFMEYKKKSLSAYQSKRSFSRTTEPVATKKTLRIIKKNKKDRIFVVHKHAARALHYDLRLAYNRVLKSWAVPKGPSLKKGVRRLAVRTEDHPLAYAKFQGEIPEGLYGAGTVQIWDSGTYHVIKKKNGKVVSFSACLKEGSIELWFDGKKLKGAYALVKMRQKNDGKKELWLLIKIDDAIAEE